jgi:hypothetical protein
MPSVAPSASPSPPALEFVAEPHVDAEPNASPSLSSSSSSSSLFFFFPFAAPLPPPLPAGASAPLPPPPPLASSSEVLSASLSLKEYRWHQNGRKFVFIDEHAKNRGIKVQATPENSVFRHYFKCAVPGCPARHHHDYTWSGSSESDTKHKCTKVALISTSIEHNDHSHPPPEKKPLDGQAKRKAKEQLQAGVKPAKVHQNLILQAADNKELDAIPSKKQLSNMAYYIKRLDLPSGDAMKNLIGIHGTQNHFLHDVRLYPRRFFLFASMWGLDMHHNGPDRGRWGARRFLAE